MLNVCPEGWDGWDCRSSNERLQAGAGLSDRLDGWGGFLFDWLGKFAYSGWVASSVLAYSGSGGQDVACECCTPAPPCCWGGKLCPSTRRFLWPALLPRPRCPGATFSLSAPARGFRLAGLAGSPG